MKYGRNFRLFWLLFSFCLQVAAQEARQVQRELDSLLQLGHQDAALPLLNRLIFFADDSSLYPLLQQKASCHYALKQYDEAARTFKMAFNKAPGDSEELDCMFGEALCRLKNGQLDLLRNKLDELDAETFTLDAWTNYQLLRGAFYVLQQNEDSARLCFLSLAQSAADSAAIRSLHSEHRRIKRMSPRLATVMSLLLPGSGHMYAGAWREGIAALLLNGGLAFLFYNTTAVYSWWDGILAISPWIVKYYPGTAKRSAELLRLRKEERLHALIARYTRLLSPQKQAAKSRH